MGVCIRWRYWASYSFDVQSTHRKSHFSEHSRSEAPQTASWLVASSVFTEKRFMSAFFFRPRLQKCLSLTWIRISVYVDICSVLQSLFLFSVTVWRDLEYGVNGVVLHPGCSLVVSSVGLQRRSLLLPPDPGRFLPNPPSQLRQRRCRGTARFPKETWSWCQGIFLPSANLFKHLFLHSRAAKILNYKYDVT